MSSEHLAAGGGRSPRQPPSLHTGASGNNLTYMNASANVDTGSVENGNDTQERESNLSVRQKRQLKKKEHKQKGTPQSKHQDGHSLPASGTGTPREVYGSHRAQVPELRETPKEIINHQKSQSFGNKFLKAGGNEATKKMTS